MFVNNIQSLNLQNVLFFLMMQNYYTIYRGRCTVLQVAFIILINAGLWFCMLRSPIPASYPSLSAFPGVQENIICTLPIN